MSLSKTPKFILEKNHTPNYYANKIFELQNAMEEKKYSKGPKNNKEFQTYISMANNFNHQGTFDKQLF